jgi:hypothetical protein
MVTKACIAKKKHYYKKIPFSIELSFVDSKIGLKLDR